MSAKDTQTWATNNLRHFSWPGSFDPELLTKSPRDVKSEDDKAAMFAKSSGTTPSARIDYFLSHAWADGDSYAEPAAQAAKLGALRGFTATRGAF